jgi:alcohol dehydrogenase (NADP+)
MIKVRGYGATSGDKTIKPMAIERSPPKPNELLIDVLYCGVCHSDVHIIDDAWGFTLYPLIPGHEAVGRVLSVGSSVTSFKNGDIVGVGCMIDSCLKCSACKEGWENHCEAPTGPTMTYGGYLVPDGSGFNTFGAWSDKLVVREEFVLRIPAGMDLAKAAPLMCPGVATYGPLKRFDIKKGDKIGIVGVGGPGHLAIMMAKAMGAEVTAFTTHEWKRDAAIKLGADNVVLSTDDEAMKKYSKYFHHILSTIPNAFDPMPYLALLSRRGTMTVMGLLGPYKNVVNNIALAARGLSLTGSMIGSIGDTQEVLEVCAEHKIVPIIEIIKLEEISEAIERLKKADVQFRFVIDLKS